MNPKSLEVCAARLPERQRAEFLRLHVAAQCLLRDGWTMRKQAWALYRAFKTQPRTYIREAGRA